MKQIKKIVEHKLKKAINTCFAFFFGFLPLNNRKIVFDNFAGKGYGDNPAYIADEIMRQKLDYDIVWIVRDKEIASSLPMGIRTAKYKSLKSMYEFSTAKVWVDNIRCTERPNKRKNQVYIQTWHSAYGFKEVEKDAINLGPSYKKKAMRDGRESDAIIASSEQQCMLYKESFWLSENTEILKFGAPRYDKLIGLSEDNVFKANVRTEFGIEEDTYTVLYAPTFRDDRSTKWYISDLNRIIGAFEEKYNKKCAVIVRLHPTVTSHKAFFEYSSKIINGTDYPDMQSLALISDCLITDYSSGIFDFILLKKDVFMYVPDYEIYKSSRGLNSEFDNCPYPKAYSLDELVEKIENFDEKARENISKYYRDNPVYKTGNASKLIVEWINTAICN